MKLANGNRSILSHIWHLVFAYAEGSISGYNPSFLGVLKKDKSLRVGISCGMGQSNTYSRINSNGEISPFALGAVLCGLLVFMYLNRTVELFPP